MYNLKLVIKESGVFVPFKIKNLIVGKDFLKIGGPCSVESYEQIARIGGHIKRTGGNIIRGGAFKPRTSPYAFQGIGIRGLEYLKEIGEKTGLPVVSEVMDVRDLDTAIRYVDIIQVGARNVQNYPLLKELGMMDIPVILKNGFCTTLQEWLSSAEYILDKGNYKVILCERGIRTHENYTRNTLDLSIVAAIKRICCLPIIIDPSHGTGCPDLIEPMCLSGICAGCDGIMVEVHDSPEAALSDGEQSILPSHFGKIIKSVDKLRQFCTESDI